ncbi:MAG: hypothetical protein AAFP86_08460, partial [Planctomycetota bacterium]
PFERPRSANDRYEPGKGQGYDMIRAGGAFTLSHYPEGTIPGRHPCELYVVDGCAVDLTQSGLMQMGNIRGAREVRIEDSCFIARHGGPSRYRHHKAPRIHIDDKTFPGIPTADRITVANTIANVVDHQGRVAGHGYLRFRLKDGRQVQESMHCPGEVIEIDCTSGEIARRPWTPQDEFDAASVPLFREVQREVEAVLN